MRMIFAIAVIAKIRKPPPVAALLSEKTIMKTQRLTLLVSPEDKRHYRNLAKERGMNMSELMREAVRAYGVNTIDDPQELVTLTAELREALPAMRRSVRQASASVERALASIASRQAKPSKTS
jgi:hypothetical protein